MISFGLQKIICKLILICFRFSVQNIIRKRYLFKINNCLTACILANVVSVPRNNFILTIFQLTKVVNEVYHQFNRHQYPFVVLTVNMEKGMLNSQ